MIQKWIQPLCLKSVLKKSDCSNKSFCSSERLCLCLRNLHYPPLLELSFKKYIYKLIRIITMENFFF